MIDAVGNRDRPEYLYIQEFLGVCDELNILGVYPLSMASRHKCETPALHIR